MIDCINSLVTLAAVDFEKVVLFYSRLLAQPEPVVYLPNVYAEFQLPGLKLAIFRPKETNYSEFGTNSSSMSLCLEVRDLKGAIAHLTDLGYPPPGKIITASHGQEVYAYDPIGNRLILHQSS